MSQKTFKKDGSAYIRSLVENAIECGRRTAVVTGDYEIDETIKLPSDFTLILENAHLRTVEGAHFSIFTNKHSETPEGRTLDGTDRNISIIGRGEAILDGGADRILEIVPEKTEIPRYKSCLILFSNVDGFKVSGLKLINMQFWATAFVYCRNGYVGNLEFCADDRRIDKDGVIHHGLIREEYDDTIIKFADGVDLREGCNHIVIENISGFVEDDTVALTAYGSGKMEEGFRVSELPSDISHVTIKNVRSSSFCSNVRLLNQGNIKLHDIDIDGVYDDSEHSHHLDHGNFAIRIGDKRMYGYRHCTKEETYNISVKNVYGRSRAVIALAGEIGNLTMFGIEAGEGTPMFYNWEKVF